MKKHQKKASERSTKGNSGFHERITISKDLFCLVCKSEHPNESVFSTRILFPSEWLHFCYHHHPKMNHGQPKIKKYGAAQQPAEWSISVKSNTDVVF